MNIIPASFLLAFLPSFLSLSWSEFTVVLPDSSALVDAPQTGFSDHAKTDPAEQRAVYAVMEDTGNGWATSIPDVCRGRWHGIECMPDKDGVYHVVSLSFGALSDDTAFPTCNPSRAFLSPAILGLPHLRSLFFYRCFTENRQPIPAFLGRLGANLRSLVLRENGHVGPIAAELGNLTSLRVLDLHGNRLSSSIPQSLHKLKHLQLLDLSFNQLNGLIPELKLPSLTIIDLSHNFLRGQIPSTIGQCDSLIKMDLSRNRLNGLMPDSLGYLNNLILLDISHNRLAGPLPSSLHQLTSLRALLLSDNLIGLSAAIAGDEFLEMKELTTLILSNNELEGPIPRSIGDLPNLRILHLDGNKFNGSIPQSFRKLEKLSEVRLNDNWLTGPIPFGKEMLWKMGRKLRVNNNTGLCYDLSNGRYEGIESMSGISYCETESSGGGRSPANGAEASSASGPTSTTRHLSSLSSESRAGYWWASGFSSSGSSTLCSARKIIWIAAILLSVVLLL